MDNTERIQRQIAILATMIGDLALALSSITGTAYLEELGKKIDQIRTLNEEIYADNKLDTATTNAATDGNTGGTDPGNNTVHRS